MNKKLIPIIPIISYLIFILLILNFTLTIKQSKTLSDNYDTNNNEKVYTILNKPSLSSNSNIVVNSNQKKFKLSEEPKTVIIANSLDEKHILQRTFNEVNVNRDKYISIQELARYINNRIRTHIENAIKMNPIIFSKIDISPRDGLISWDEYFTYFLHERGLNENINDIKSSLEDPKIKEDILKDKISWSEAAKTDPFTLTLDEFLAFRHPESSTVNLLGLVDDLLRLFDINGDDHLTIDEFSDVTVDEVDEKYRKSIISKTVDERREEFERIIDKNKDGKADREELLLYVDPRHPKYALQEAATLINITDFDRDGMLSLKEVLANSKIFMTSKMIDTSSSFHDEF